MEPLKKTMDDLEAHLAREWAKQEADDARREDAERLEVISLVRRRIPEFCRCSMTELAQRAHPDLLTVAHRWSWGSPNLLLLGKTGAGKTSAAALIVRLLTRHGVRVGGPAFEKARHIHWAHAAQIAMAERQWPLGHGRSDRILRWERAELMVIDDAGWDMDPVPVSMLLNARMEAGLPTIITSGKRSGELQNHYGDAVVRRMLEPNGKVVQVW